MPIPQVTLEKFENEYRDFHVLPAALDYWASRNPDGIAIRNATRGTQLTWAELRRASMLLAGQLKRMGFRKGDFLATSLPLLNELVVLEYACFRLGVIHAPLDLRLQTAELLRSLGLIRARGYAFAAGASGEEVHAHSDSVEILIQFAPVGNCIPGAVSFDDVMARAAAGPAPVECEAGEHDAAQAIFTTGSTGSPKPALLGHRGITCQNLCLGTAFGFGPSQRVLCNLPPSHVGGQAEVLLTSLFMGGTTVTVEAFDPVKSLDAMEREGVTLIGQIPAMFQMEWRTADYARRNFPALKTAVYGGQAVPRPFLNKMIEMAPRIGTGLGLTESSGFCTYTELTGDADAVSRGVGWAMPAYRMTIRGPMASGGSAGAELSAGEVGHVCFQGPQNFLGYAGDPESTAAALSTDGWLYTGDMGFAGEHGLHLRGRAKWVLKPAGYLVFPSDIENHFSSLEKVASVGVVGHEHRLWSEGIVAFIEKRPGAELSETELKRHARALTSYMRPLHYVILEPGAMPLNRTAKVDVRELQARAGEEVRRLRERGRWDA